MELTNYQNYQEYKKALDGELQKTAEGFVRIGYLLKVARDTDILAGSGYAGVTDFAQKEYGLDKTQVSRFISINERFAQGTERLLPEYEEYGYAKLTIMLQIPEEITRELTPGYSKAEIQAVKEELDEEKKVSDLEVLMEGQKEEEEGTLYRTLKQLGHDDPVLWENLWNARMPFLTWDEIGEIMAPSGDKVYSVRILGAGRVMMTMKDGEDAVVITNTRTFEKETFSKQMVANEWARLLKDEETAGKAWEKVYAELWPCAKVAPVQRQKEPAKEQPKKQAKKGSKVSKAKVPEKPKKLSTEPAPAAVAEEPQLEGQMSVEDYPGVVPEEGENHGKNVGMAAGNNQPDESDCGRDDDPYGGSEGNEEAAGDAVQGNNEGTGAPESGGRETDHETVAFDARWAWTQLWDDWNKLWGIAPVSEEQLMRAEKEKIEDLHEKALNFAASLEKLMIWRERNNEG